MTDYFKEIGFSLTDDPVLESLKGGRRPTPSRDYFDEIGYNLESADAAGDDYKPDDYFKEIGYEPNFGPSPGEVGDAPDRSVGESIVTQTKEGLKDVGRAGAWGVLAHSRFMNRLKDRFIPESWSEKMADSIFMGGLATYSPHGLALAAATGMPEAAEDYLQSVLESELMAADPNARPQNYFEDFIRMGPQIGMQILASVLDPTHKIGGKLAMGLQIMGGTYKELIDQGVSPDRAYWYSIANAAIQAPMEDIPFQKMRRMFKPQRKLLQRIRDYASVGTAELLTEWGQSYPDSFINILATNPDKSLLERAGMFWDKIEETTKQGMYEGAVAAPWALLTGGMANAASATYNKLKGKTKPPEDIDDNIDRLPEVNEVPDKYKPDQSVNLYNPEPPMIPDNTAGFTRAPTRASSNVTARHLEMMTEKQREAHYNKEFDKEFEERKQESKAIYLKDEERKIEALKAANEHAKTKHVMSYLEGDIEEITMREENGEKLDPFNYISGWEDRVGAERKRIQKGLDLVAHQDIYSPEAVALSQAEYDRRVKLLGTVEGLYDVDKNQVPADLRGAISLMSEQVGQAEPKSAGFINKDTGEMDLQSGEAQANLSTYPDWFKTPFQIEYVGKEKGKKDLSTKTEDFKHGLKRTDFYGIMTKLEAGTLLTARENAIADHIFGMAMAIKDSDHELTQGADISELERDGYDVVGEQRNYGAFDLGDQVVFERPDGRWDNYTLVSEDDGEGNMVFDSLTDRMYAKPAELIKTVAHKKNGYWEALYELGGVVAVDEAKPSLPGYDKISPMSKVTEKSDTASLEQNFEAVPLPDKAETFKAPDIGREPVDRRKREKKIGLERRKEDRRQDWVTRGDINDMTPADQVQAIEELRKMSMKDSLTGVYGRGEWDRHVGMIGTDVPHMFIDLDGFKWINDFTKAGILPDGRRVPGGHKMGDQVLGFFGQVMKKTAELTGVGDRVFLFRYGGDEFSVLPSEKDAMTVDDMKRFESALREVANSITVDMLGNNDESYQLEGLPYTSGVGGTVDAAIAIAEKAKEGKPARYQQVRGQVTRAKIPPTLAEKRVEDGRGDKGLARVPEAKRLPPPEGYIEEEGVVEPKVAIAPGGKPTVGVKATLSMPKPPAEKPKASEFVKENVSILEGNDFATVDVSYRDPATGEITKMKESVSEAVQGVEDSSDMLYKFRECIKS